VAVLLRVSAVVEFGGVGVGLGVLVRVEVGSSVGGCEGRIEGGCRCRWVLGWV